MAWTRASPLGRESAGAAWSAGGFARAQWGRQVHLDSKRDGLVARHAGPAAVAGAGFDGAASACTRWRRLWICGGRPAVVHCLDGTREPLGGRDARTSSASATTFVGCPGLVSGVGRDDGASCVSNEWWRAANARAGTHLDDLARGVAA